MDLNKFFRLYANCIVVKGYRRSIILDLQEERFLYIPNQLYFLIVEEDKKTLNDIINIYNTSSEYIIEYYRYIEN